MTTRHCPLRAAARLEADTERNNGCCSLLISTILGAARSVLGYVFTTDKEIVQLVANVDPVIATFHWFGLWSGFFVCVVVQAAFFLVVIYKMNWRKASEQAMINAGMRLNVDTTYSSSNSQANDIPTVSCSACCNQTISDARGNY
ncbi:multidrug and toxin extrusion protein 1-like isoform X2 [Hemitrygon akajei]|uniref:multidrug and toxin extrusion protein 1-like isoform X2 n=1 Tax=Hemitrygon akajei TaxID=2704970 RepID=UPI003BF95A76